MPIPFLIGAALAGGAAYFAAKKSEENEQARMNQAIEDAENADKNFMDDFCNRFNSDGNALWEEMDQFAKSKGYEGKNAYIYSVSDYAAIKSKVLNKRNEVKQKSDCKDNILCMQALDFACGDVENAITYANVADFFMICFEVNIFAFAENGSVEELAQLTGLNQSTVQNYFNANADGDRSTYLCLVFTAYDICSDTNSILSYFDCEIHEDEINEILDRANGDSDKLESICKIYVTSSMAEEQHQQTVNRAVSKIEKFTTLGLSGSGKTCFMAGMYYKLSAGANGFTLKASDDDEVLLCNMYEKLRDKERGADRFPSSTNQSKSYTFELLNNYKPIRKFEWIDYKGGILKEKNSGNPEEYAKLLEDISQSQTLFVFVDGQNFCDEEIAEARNDREKLSAAVDIVMDECARSINHFIADYASKNGKLPPVAIVVTKFDLATKGLNMGAEDAQSFVDEVIKKAFNALIPDASSFRSNSGMDSFVAILPVSLGPKISEDGDRGRLRPIGMEIPAFMGIWFMLEHLKEIDSANKEQYEESMHMLSDEIGNAGIHCFLNGQRGKFAELAKAYCKKN